MNNNNFESGYNNENLLKGITDALNGVNSFMKELSSSPAFSDAINSLVEINKKMSGFIVSDYMRDTYSFIYEWIMALEESIKNPASIYSYIVYKEKLGSFYWAWPFDIKPDELQQILGTVQDEESFDKIMLSVFDDKKMEKLFSFLNDSVSEQHKIIFQQIEEVYKLGYYAIANNAIMSIIDNELLFLVESKDTTKRKGILKPIIDYYGKNYPISDVPFWFYIIMLANNIDILFEKVVVGEFALEVSTKTRKKERRHSALHGLMYSNEQIGTIMLLNTLSAILLSRRYILPFRDSLQKQNGNFIIIPSKVDIVKARIENELNSDEG